MNKKELKNLAKKIAKAELIIQRNEDETAVKAAKKEIIELSGHVKSLEDMELLDDLIQDFLSENS